MRILVVEDNDLVADAITMGLSTAGFVVDRSASAEAAATALATEHFDLLVVDVGLPGEDGLALVRRLRSRGATQPVLILTARDTLAIKVEALNLGADDFLLKPFEQDELVARCRALIRRANLYAGEQVNLAGCDWMLSGACCASMRRRWNSPGVNGWSWNAWP
jgi:DNA-binding response OmpR family regulator